MNKRLILIFSSRIDLWRVTNETRMLYARMLASDTSIPKGNWKSSTLLRPHRRKQAVLDLRECLVA
jgi:hypothetical protein